MIEDPLPIRLQISVFYLARKLTLSMLPYAEFSFRLFHVSKETIEYVLMLEEVLQDVSLHTNAN